jgi:hypothetical protein
VENPNNVDAARCFLIDDSVTMPGAFPSDYKASQIRSSRDTCSHLGEIGQVVHTIIEKLIVAVGLFEIPYLSRIGVRDREIKVCDTAESDYALGVTLAFRHA